MFTPKYRNPDFAVIPDFLFQKLVEKKENIYFHFCPYTMFTGVWRYFWMCLSDLTSQTPQKGKSLQMGPQNTFIRQLKSLVYSIFGDLGPIFDQIGPIVGTVLDISWRRFLG